MMSTNKKLFLSFVNSEFKSYRQLLASDLMRPTLDVATEEDFVVSGGKTLEKLDHYIRACDGVVHVIGKATGSVPEAAAVAALLSTYNDFADRLPPLADALAKSQPDFSYTQWEAYLAIYHGKPLFVYRPTDFEAEDLGVPRDANFVYNADEYQSQRDHYDIISSLGHDRGQFLNKERLSSKVLRDLVEILPRLEMHAQVDISQIVDYAPEELIGREDEIAMLNEAWAKVQSPERGRPYVLTYVALGGEGKTSLAAHWAVRLAAQDWPGCEAAFAWSFYNQGAQGQIAASSDIFLKEALIFFGGESEKEFAGGAASAYEKGQKLARLIGRRCCLLILDGLEPLQYAPIAPTRGELKDQGITALLKGLASANHGLCVVTTRYSISDLKAFRQSTSPEVTLKRLSRAAGVQLLQSLGVRGSLLQNTEIKLGNKMERLNEYENLVEEVQGHALTLNLLGTYLRDAHGGDIRKRDLVRLHEADEEEQGGHAFRVMDAYAIWLETGGKNDAENLKGRYALALLRLLGLFDRPASADCLIALWTREPIPRLTDAVVGLSEVQRTVALNRLKEAKLLTVNRDASGTLIALDAHPLLREYFARSLKDAEYNAWCAGHRRLYDHLCKATREGIKPSLEELQPLYQAIVHGCHAGLHQEACIQIYRDRILRRKENYAITKLGAYGVDLGATACFFERPWTSVKSSLAQDTQAWLFHEAAFRLRALSRLDEALEPSRAGMARSLELNNWENAINSASNVIELEVLLGQVSSAVQQAAAAVVLSDEKGKAYQQVRSRAGQAYALHQAGRCTKANKLFLEAERAFREGTAVWAVLSSVQGFHYRDLLLCTAERSVWQCRDAELAAFANSEASRDIPLTGQPHASDVQAPHKALFNVVLKRTYIALEMDNLCDDTLGVSLNHLTLGCVALYASILATYSKRDHAVLEPLPDWALACRELDLAVDGFRRAGTQDEIPRGLLSRAWLRFQIGKVGGPQSAQEDLDEAWEIAERGPMRLFMADVHMYRARLFMREEVYPWESPEVDLAAARKLIQECGYHRRDEELADAEAALKGWREEQKAATVD